MSDEFMEDGIDSLKARMKHPILREFADYLYAGRYTVDEIESLLLKEWDSAIPVSGDELTELGSFLYYMGDFVVEKVIKDSTQKIGGRWLDVRIVPDPSLNDVSYVYIVERTTRSLLADEGCGCDTSYHDPDSIANDLADLEAQVKSGWELVQRRVLALNLLGSPTDLPLRGAEDERPDTDHS